MGRMRVRASVCACVSALVRGVGGRAGGEVEQREVFWTCATQGVKRYREERVRAPNTQAMCFDGQRAKALWLCALMIGSARLAAA